MVSAGPPALLQQALRSRSTLDRSVLSAHFADELGQGDARQVPSEMRNGECGVALSASSIVNLRMNPNKALWEKGDFTRIADTMRESGEAT